MNPKSVTRTNGTFQPVSRLPSGWSYPSLDEIGKVVTGSTPPKAQTKYYGGNFPLVKPPELRNCIVSSAGDTLTAAGAEVAEIAPEGSVLVSCIGNLGKVALAARSVAFNQQINAVIPFARPSSKWLFYAVQAPEFLTQLQSAASATTISIVNKGKFSKLRIPWASDSERRRIVAEIEKQFTRLDAGVASLKRVQTALKRYRASVLKAACEGRLIPTEAELARQESRSYENGEQLLAHILEQRRVQWESAQLYKFQAADKLPRDDKWKTKYEEPNRPCLAEDNLKKLPEGWTWVTVAQLTPATRPCAYGVLQPGGDVADGVQIVRVGDINGGKVDQSNLKRISPKIAAQYPRTRLEGGEVAISLVGAIGRTAVIPVNLAGANTARAVGVMPLTGLVSAHWVEIWFRNPAMIAEMISKSHEVARKTLNLEDVRTASIALPPIVEQQRVVADVERRLSVIEELEMAVTANLKRAERLRQSILHRAFTGTLADVDIG